MGPREVAVPCAVAAVAAAFAAFATRRTRQDTSTEAAKEPLVLLTDTDEVDSVLGFWFGRDLEKQGAQLWFARGAARDAADALVEERFGDLVRAAEQEGLDGWTASPRGVLAAVVVFDQLARHVFRGESARLLALSKRASALYEEHFGEKWDSALELSPSRQAFGWMCRRHDAPTAEELRRLLAEIDSREAHDAAESRVLTGFRKATARRLRVAESAVAHDDDLLERAEFEPTPEAVEKALFESPLGCTLRDFLLKECAAHTTEELRFGDPTDKGAETTTVCLVSLSGGVDSMVIAWLLAELARRIVNGNFQVKAVHVDYGNREESTAEADFLEGWCRRVGIPLRVERMPADLKRGEVDRDFYERRARDLRFALYKNERQTAKTPVLLGHHSGDVVENCLSNALKGINLLGLSGMSTDQVTQGVRLARPLLRHPKSDVFAVAHACGIPYFKDTTPKWSNRGRIREEVLPLLKDVYGEGCTKHLERLALEADAMSEVAHAKIFKPFFDSQRTTQIGTVIEAGKFRNEGEFFWRHVLRELAHSLGMGALSEKALRVLLARLNGHKGHKEPKRRRQQQRLASLPTACAGWLELKKDWMTYLDAEGRLFIFSDGFFDGSDGSVSLDGASCRVGSWTARTVRSEAPTPFAPTTLEALFETQEISYDLVGGDVASFKPEERTSSNKQPQLRELDALTESLKLRGALRLVGAPPFHGSSDRYRVTYTFTPNQKRADELTYYDT